ncbi:hypothetical protein HPB47_015133 [Ixodes persulcatus]|uniref:Uncharacterized protein n=1 Tax=Ixodes persulcatus TaxID=34615 RepID=A0AC60R3E6_IXOPE|nr:hypothetical protein HPB47_015133 [Ixodes persulcatus]
MNFEIYTSTPKSLAAALLATLRKSGTRRLFPTDKSTRKKWVLAVRRERWLPSKNSRICSDHFSPDCYDAGVRLKESFGLGGDGHRKKLIKSADRATSVCKEEKNGLHPQRVSIRQQPLTGTNNGLMDHWPAPMDMSSDLYDGTDCSSLEETIQVVIRLLSLMGVKTLQKTQFFKFQRCYLLPAVQEVWESEQNLMVEASRGQKLCLSGDGRADSPGHSADFGTYTLMDVNRNRVFHIELVKSTEVSSSNRMEKEGLARAFSSFESKNVKVDMLVTDRHREVNAYVRDNHPDVLHRFDAWHFAKGIKKKIDSVSGTKAHNVLRKWKRTIIRHLYWCARTSNGDGELVLAKWRSIMRHVIDVHVHIDPLHPACAHGTETFRRLESVLVPAHLLKDIPRISHKQQTYALESFHALLIHYAPKSTKFTYAGMLAR